MVHIHYIPDKDFIRSLTLFFLASYEAINLLPYFFAT